MDVAYSAVIPVALMTLIQRSLSWRRNWAVSAEVPPPASRELVESQLAISGVRKASCVAAEILLAMAGGVPGGANMPNQFVETKPGKVSETVGRSGSKGLRFSLLMASARSLPERMYGRAEPKLMNIISTWPLTRSVRAGALPL